MSSQTGAGVTDRAATGSPLLGGESRLEVLYDHYKEIVTALHRQIFLRMQLIVAALIVLALMAGHRVTDTNPIELIEGGKFGIFSIPANLDLPPYFVASLLWFTLGALVLQTFQRTLVIDCTAAYLRGLESRLDPLIGAGCIVQRRSRFRPRFLEIADVFYSSTLLLIFLTITSLTVYLELLAASWETWYFLLFDLFIYVFVVGATAVFVRDYRRLARSKAQDCEVPDP